MPGALINPAPAQQTAEGDRAKVDPNIVNSALGYVPLVAVEATLAIVACVLFLGGTFRANRHMWGSVALVGLVLAAHSLLWTYLHVPTVPLSLANLDKESESERGSVSRKIADQYKDDKNLQAEKLAAANTELKAKYQAKRTALYASPIQHSSLSNFIKLITLVGGVLLVLLSWDEATDAHAAEYHANLLLILAGTCLVSSANDLVTLFLSLELISIPTYVLLYLPRSDRDAQEAAMKYFLLSVFSSALLLFGFSYLYGLTGATNLSALATTFRQASYATEGIPKPIGKVILVALLMIVAGLGFRITAVPFHFYAPDVYQGAPTASAALLAFIPKIAGFVALVRILEGVPLPLSDQMPVLLWIMAAVTMSLGNVLALLQDNLKRMLAYSSVAHAGYMLIGLAVAMRLQNEDGPLAGGVEALLFYLVAYGAMTLGAFAVISYLDTPERPVQTVDDLAGLARTHPGTALLMVVFLFSLLGMPLTAGFWGKLLLFAGALGVTYTPSTSGQNWLFLVLAVIGAINAAIGAWYYLRIAAVMYLLEAVNPIPKRKRGPVLVSIGLCAAITLILGIYPPPLLTGVKSAMRSPDEVAAARAN